MISVCNKHVSSVKSGVKSSHLIPHKLQCPVAFFVFCTCQPLWAECPCDVIHTPELPVNTSSKNVDSMCSFNISTNFLAGAKLFFFLLFSSSSWSLSLSFISVLCIKGMIRNRQVIWPRSVCAQPQRRCRSSANLLFESTGNMSWTCYRHSFFDM